MSDPVNAPDETASFVTATSDAPQVEAIEPEAKEPAPAKAEPEAKEVESKQPEATPEQNPEPENDGGDTPAEPAPKKARSAQKRIDKVVREREDTKRENEALQRRVAELEGKQAEKPEAKKTPEQVEPKEDDFESYDEYLDAVDKFEKQEPAKENKPNTAEPNNPQAPDNAEQSTDLTDSQKTAMAVIKEAVADADKPEDFDAIALNPEVPITGDMLEALAECDDVAKVMYALGNDTELAAAIAGKTPAQQMRAIAKLDMAEAAPAKPAKPNKQTNAPDPITPVGGSDAQQKSIDDMSFSEYEAHQNKIEQERNS
ncbi:MAG: hypothetical protein RPR40_13705 [Bermanella sp.]